MSATLAAPNTATAAQPVRLSGRWLRVARAAWWLLAGYPSLQFVLGLSPAFEIMRVPCDPAACNTIHWLALLPEQAQVLQAAGLSLDLYAAYMNGLEALLAAVYAGCGLLVFLRRRDEGIALLASLALVVLGVFLIPNAPHSAVVLFPALAGLSAPTFIWGNWLFPALLFLLPDGRFVPRWTRWLYPVWGLLVTYSLLTHTPYAEQPTTDTVDRVAGITLALLALVAAGGQVYRYRRVATPQQRQQIKWIALGLLGFAGGIFVGTAWHITPMSVGQTPIGQRILGVTAYTLGQTFLPVALTFAVLRHRLWDIDVVLNRGLVYGGLTTSIVALYAVFVGGLSAIFHAQGSGWVVFAGAALAALLLQPLRAWLQRLANRLIYGQRDEPYAVLAGFGRKLEATGALETTLAALAGTIQQALKLPYAGLEAQGVAGLSGTSAPAARRRLIDIPLVYQHETVGRLRVAPRDGESNLSGADRRLLEDLARQAAVAVHAARVTAALRLARERLVSSQEEERRRLRRDLHDGLGPALAALAAQAEAARDLIATQPETSRDLLADLIAQAQAATADIRRLVYNLRPPALDDLGLVGALRVQADRSRQPGHMAVTLAVEPLPDLPAAVEVAAYRIVQEATANAARHAGASTCHIVLRLDARCLYAEVNDDGRGLPPAIEAGVGLGSMRERAEELGGRLVITSESGRGTTVAAWLPLPGLREPWAG